MSFGLAPEIRQNRIQVAADCRNKQHQFRSIRLHKIRARSGGLQLTSASDRRRNSSCLCSIWAREHEWRWPAWIQAWTCAPRRFADHLSMWCARAKQPPRFPQSKIGCTRRRETDTSLDRRSAQHWLRMLAAVCRNHLAGLAAAKAETHEAAATLQTHSGRCLFTKIPLPVQTRSYPNVECNAR